MSKVEPVDIGVGERGAKDPDDAVSLLNRILLPVVSRLRDRFNDLMTQAINGVLTIGGTNITVGTGAPASSTDGHLYIRTDGDAGTMLYTKEATLGWVPMQSGTEPVTSQSQLVQYGVGAPAAAHVGLVYVNTAGAEGTTLYVNHSGTWLPIGAHEINFWFLSATSIAGYETLSEVPATATVVDETVSVSSSDTGGVVFDPYMAEVGVVTSGEVSVGEFQLHGYFYVSTGTTCTVKFSLSVYHADTTETAIFTSGSSVAITSTSSTVPQFVNIHYTLTTPYTMAADDRIVARVIGFNSAVAARTLHWVYQGPNFPAHLETPFT